MQTNAQAAAASSARVRVRRQAVRAVYDQTAILAVLDAGLVCHVGYEVDRQPYVTPTSYWRQGEHLFWHASSASQMLRRLAGGIPACVTVTHLDGLVLARSGFNHAVNYRCVMAFGTAHAIAEREKPAALRAFMDRLFPGRWDEVRAPSEQELKATTILTMPLDEVSAKIRNGPPELADVDLNTRCWAGVIPLGIRARAPVADADLMPTPRYATTINERFQLSVPYPPND